MVSIMLLAILFSTCQAQQRVFTDINALFIPHTHDDPGWQISFESYYERYVRSILNSITNYLTTHNDYKFVWCETSFLHRWWEEAQSEQRSAFQSLVSQGRIEIVGGGWVMHDEATPDFRDMIEQMDLGLTYIYELFGVQPNTIWQIDPFGHGSTTAAIAVKLGFTSVMLNRIALRENSQGGH